MTAPVSEADTEAPGAAQEQAWWRSELLMLLEIAAVTGFVVARPQLGTFGESPETFMARGATRMDVVAFGVLVVVLPALVVGAASAGTRAFGRRARGVVHAGVIGVGVALWVMQVAGLDGRLLWAVAATCGLLVTVARWRLPSVGTFFRFAGAASLVFLAQFLFMSPVSTLVLGGRGGGADDAAAAAAGDVLGDDAPPVVMVVLDGLSTATLLDGNGHIDREAFPNIARLADDSTWYRNHTTVAPLTLQALPAILTGAMPDGSAGVPVWGHHPRNLFTLLGGSHEMHVSERITGLCPEALCPIEGGAVPDLLGDAVDDWVRMMTDSTDTDPLPGALGPDRLDRFTDWIHAQDFAGDADGRPGLFFYHLLMPHDPWEILPDGSVYDAALIPSGTWFGTWGSWGAQVGHQRHLLQAQAADRALGELLDRMQAAGTYDDAVVVLTADHGWGFRPDEPQRMPSSGNFDEIMWTPLLIKSAGSTEGHIDDSNVASTDLLPTIADELGVALPWPVDGVPAHATAGRAPGDKQIQGWIVDPEGDQVEDGRPDGVVTVDGLAGFQRLLEADAVAGTGDLGAWHLDGSYGELVGRPIDDLPTGKPHGGVMQVTDLPRWDQVDLDRPPLEILGMGPLEMDDTVAISVNGTVAAVVKPAGAGYGVPIVHALLWPGSLRDGANEIRFHRLDGPADRPVAHEIDVEDRP